MTEEIETQENNKLPVLRGELALLVVVLINSLGVVLMLYSGSGISAISSVPYAFSEVFNKISLGTWTYIFQGLLVLSLMIMRKKFVAQSPVNIGKKAVDIALDILEGKDFEKETSVDVFMTNDSVVVSARDKDGKLIDVSAMGVTVEETGKSYTTPITIAALLAGGGICGVSAIIFAAGKKKRNEEQA